MSRTSVALIFAAGFCMIGVSAALPEPSFVTPDQVKWAPAPSIPKGAMMTTLQGNPGQPGPYVVRVKFPANYELPAHAHADDRTYTVLSGALYLGDGEKFDNSKLKTLPVGTFLTLPAGQKHFQASKVETIVQIAGNGPSNTEYVNAADDPRKK